MIWISSWIWINLVQIESILQVLKVGINNPVTLVVQYLHWSDMNSDLPLNRTALPKIYVTYMNN